MNHRPLALIPYIFLAGNLIEHVHSLFYAHGLLQECKEITLLRIEFVFLPEKCKQGKGFYKKSRQHISRVNIVGRLG